MNKNILIYPILFISVFFMTAISLLSLQNNDIKIPQKETTITLDVKHKFNIKVASRYDEPKHKF